MQRQVITVSPEGIISGLQRKRDQGVDLRQFGPCDIRRASHILPTVDGQAWFVEVIAEGREYFMTAERWHEALDTPPAVACLPGASRVAAGGLLLFADYDDAVKAEIAFLDALRVKGEF